MAIGEPAPSGRDGYVAVEDRELRHLVPIECARVVKMIGDGQQGDRCDRAG